jgi:hypothetical protein
MVLKSDPEDRRQELNITVLFCNPNAGYYEYGHIFQKQWVDFYLGRGINVMLWNYRGYGRSEGSPTPKLLLADGELVVKYLKEERKVLKLILHGESLGGAIAARLAAKLKVDFLFADRTFSSLDKVAAVFSYKFAGAIFRHLSGWDLDCANTYIQSTCYKVIGNDPGDGMIHELASLKSSVSLTVTYPFKKYIENEYYILTPKELNLLYKDLVYLYDLASKEEVRRRRRWINNIIVKHEEAKLIINKDSDRESNDDFESELIELASEIVDNLEEVNAAGVTFGKILKNKKRLHMEMLKMYMVNIYVWGSPSYLPSVQYLTSTKLADHHTKAIVS